MGLSDKFRLADVARTIAEIAQTRSTDSRRTALRRIGLIYLLELTEPIDDDRSMTAQAIAVRQSKIAPIATAVNQLLVPPSDAHGAQFNSKLEFMFRRAPPGKKMRGSLTRFLRLRIPDVCFDDLEPLLKPLGCNRYDVGYAIRDGLNAIFERNTEPTRVARVMPDKPYDGVWAVSCHPPPPGDGFIDKYGWEIKAMALPDAWKLAPPGSGGRYGAGISVGHPDTGYSDHPALIRGQRLFEDEGENCVDDDSDARDPLDANLVDSEPGHGTMTATQIMSSDPNDPESPVDPNRVIGAATRADIVPIRVCDWTAFIINGAVAEGIVWAVDQGCHVISLSVGGLWVPGGEDAVQQAYDANIIVVAAAGNCIDFVAYPAAYGNCLAVGASKSDSTYWEHAPDDAKIDLATPGDNVRTTCIKVDQQTNIPSYSYNWGSGTSFATAFTAGVCALWLSFWDRDQLIQSNLGQLQDVFTKAAKSTAYLPAGWDTSVHGAGILNALNLLMPENSPFPHAAVPQSGAPQPADTFLNHLTAVVYGKSDEQRQMLLTTRTWFGLGDDTSARDTLDNLGGEMVNALVEYGATLRRKTAILKPSDYYKFFQSFGSYTLRSALSAGTPGP